LPGISAEGKTDHILNTSCKPDITDFKDSLLVATDGGLYLVSNNFQYRKINDSLLNISGFMSMAVLGKYYLLATANRGFIIYNSSKAATGSLPRKMD
jgi:hypothetical protein